MINLFHKKSEKGFTLIEMLISIAISSMIFYTMFAVLRRGGDHMHTTEIKMHLQESARLGLQRMIEDVRQSSPSRITITNSGSGLQFQIPNTSNSVGNDYRINWAGSHTIQYALGGLNGTQLIRTNTTTGATKVLANDVTSVAFVGNQVNPTIVTMTLNAQRRLTTGALFPATPLQLVAQAEVRNPVS